MKVVLSLAVLAFSAMASAYPALKDKAVYNGTFQGGGGGGMSFTQTLEIVNALNNNTQFVVRQTLNLPNGQTQSQDNTFNASDLLDKAMVGQILAQCTQAGGALEALTVPAGSFQTCALPQERGGKVWVGDAAFGIIKQIQIDEEENIITVELASFVNGQ
jgi:putative hemolysin